MSHYSITDSSKSFLFGSIFWHSMSALRCQGFFVSTFFHADTFSIHFPVFKNSLSRGQHGKDKYCELPKNLCSRHSGSPQPHRQKHPSLFQVSPIQWCTCWLWFSTANHLSSSVHSLLCNGKLTTSTSPFQAASVAQTASGAVVFFLTMAMLSTCYNHEQTEVLQ